MAKLQLVFAALWGHAVGYEFLFLVGSGNGGWLCITEGGGQKKPCRFDRALEGRSKIFVNSAWCQDPARYTEPDTPILVRVQSKYLHCKSYSCYAGPTLDCPPQSAKCNWIRVPIAQPRKVWAVYGMDIWFCPIQTNSVNLPTIYGRRDYVHTYLPLIRYKYIYVGIYLQVYTDGVAIA